MSAHVRDIGASMRCRSFASFEHFVELLANERFRAALLSDDASSGEFGFLDQMITSADAHALTRDIILDGYEPDGNAEPVGGAETAQNLRIYLRAAISSAGFRRDFPFLLKRRRLIANLLFHVHIHKCGGHALFALLDQNGYRAWHRRALEYSGWESYLNLLGEFLGQADRPAYVVGHYRLAELLPFVEPGDPLLVLIRDPVERALSMINYVFTVLQRDPTLIRPDACAFAEMLDGKVRPQEHTLETMIELPRIQQYVMTQISRMLALDSYDERPAIAATLIQTSALSRWLADCGERYGLRGELTRENVSQQFFTPEVATPALRARLSVLMRQDCAMYDSLTHGLGDRGYGEAPLSAFTVGTSAD